MIESKADFEVFDLTDSLNQGFSKGGPWTSRISHHLEICYKWKFLGLKPDLLNK